MDTEQSLKQMEQFLGAAAALTQQYERQMGAFAEQARQQLDSAVSQQKREMMQFVRENIQSELDSVLKGYAADMEEVRQKMVTQSSEFNTYLSFVNRKNRQLAFRSWLAVSVSLAVLLIGGAWIAYYYAQVVGKNKVDAETAQLIGQADLVRCGDDLCVKAGKLQKNGYRVVLKR
ncbi:hypothetical protein [Neisseria dentiae]|uniref:hypothetical protein n=1 Tax=Neisseria dentiae TaxID=194197 RepID=UPI00359F1D08